MTIETAERIEGLWDIAQKVFTAVLAAALIGIYSQLQSATLELARTSERWTIMIQQVNDHEGRIRRLEMQARSLSFRVPPVSGSDERIYPQPNADILP